MKKMGRHVLPHPLKTMFNILSFMLIITTTHAQTIVSPTTPAAPSPTATNPDVIFSLHDPLPGLACLANNCKTLRGAVQCLNTGSFASYLSDTRFFYKDDKTNTNILRMVPIVVKVQKVSISDGTAQGAFTFEPVKVQKVITLVNPLAYKSFLQTARQNPNCLNTFCQNNCLTIAKIDPKLVNAQATNFSKAIVPISIGGATYSAYTLRHMDNETRKSLALYYLLNARNSTNTGICLGEDITSILTRMLCTQCTLTLKDTSQMNTTCTSFDPSTQVAYDQQPQDDNATYQAQLASILIQQNQSIQNARGNTAAPGASINVTQLLKKLNTAVTTVTNVVTTYNTAVTTYNNAPDIYNTSRNDLNNYASDKYNTETANISNAANTKYNEATGNLNNNAYNLYDRGAGTLKSTATNVYSTNTAT